MKLNKIYVCYGILAVMILILHIFYRNGRLEEFLFCRDSGIMWLQCITAQFMHVSFIYCACNLAFGIYILRKLKEKYSLLQLLLIGIFAMLLVGAALLIFSKPAKVYAGFNGIVSGWYALCLTNCITYEKSISKKIELIVDGMMFFFISMGYGEPVWMQLTGLLAGAVGFKILKIFKINKGD